MTHLYDIDQQQQEKQKHFQFLSSFFVFVSPLFQQMHKTTGVQGKKQLNWVLPLSLSRSRRSRIISDKQKMIFALQLYSSNTFRRGVTQCTLHWRCNGFVA